MRIRGLKNFEWHTLKGQVCTSQPAPNLLQEQALRLPRGWLKISGSHGYPHYDQVNHRW